MEKQMNNELVIQLMQMLLTNSGNNENAQQSTSSNLYTDVIGKYVIVRSRNEGLNAGYLEKADHTGCVLKNAQRLYRPISKDKSLSWYEGVAKTGLAEESKISGTVDSKIIVEDYSITICSEVAKNSIEGFTPNETTC